MHSGVPLGIAIDISSIAVLLGIVLVIVVTRISRKKGFSLEFFIVGAFVGLLVSYLFRPTTAFGTSPSFTDWFKGDVQNSAAIIFICALVGAVVGFAVDRMLDASRRKTSAATPK